MTQWREFARQVALESTSLMEILKTTEDQLCPVSHAQQTEWYTQQLAPDNAAFNDAFTIRIRSPLDVSALRRACRTLSARHPALRTTYSLVNGELAQVVQPDSNAPLETINALGWTWEETLRQVTLAYRRPFDLERGPVWRV